MEKQKIKINRKVMSSTKEIEVKSDIIVPDIKPDIVAIKSTNANTYIYKSEISRGKLRIDGNIDGYVLYLAENGESRSLEITLDFNTNIEEDSLSENMKCKTNVAIQNIETKILNERKISITANVKIESDFYELEEIEFIKSIEDTKIQLKEEKYKIKKVIGGNSAKAVLKESVEANNQMPISEIVKVNFELSNIENKASFNKVLSKADLNLNIVYQTEELKEDSITVTFPITSFIDIENVSEEYILDTTYCLRNMLFKVDSVVPSKITFEVDFEVNLDVYEEEEISIVQDMYSLEKDVEIKSKEIELQIGGEDRKINIIEDVEEKECESKNEYSMVVYFVKPCDTLWKIAKMFKVTMESIIKANNIENPDKINVGEKLYIVK
jgi:nucleoid-associated protein YgaU